jgi:hypothetical protein
MPEGLTSALQSIQPELQAGTEVAGLGSTAYNMYNQYQNQQYQNQLRSFAQDPAKMNAYAAQFTQPLNAGLTTSVANNTQAYLAQHGLTDSPEIAQTVQAQAIAPYIQQNQQAGYQDALQALQVGGGAVNPNNNSANTISSLAKMFAGGGGTTAPGGLQALQNYLRTMGTQAPQLSGVGAPSGPAPGPVDTSGWDSGAPDMSSFYQPDYSAGGGDSAPYLGSD